MFVLTVKTKIFKGTNYLSSCIGSQHLVFTSFPLTFQSLLAGQSCDDVSVCDTALQLILVLRLQIMVLGCNQSKMRTCKDVEKREP